MERVYTFLKNNIKDDYVVIGVSGGVDSMVLLSIIKNLLSSKIVCAHVHHNLRSESDFELEFVRDYCLKNNIIFESIKLEYEDKFSEEVARNKRYNFFEQILNKYNSKTLITAHHGDDQIETVMMKIVRGSTLKGYSGIEKVSDRSFYKIYRPLLYLTKEDIYRYAVDNNISYCEDYTNHSDEYTRNRYRKYLLPFLKEEKEDVHLKFLDFSESLLEYNEYIDKKVDECYKKCVIENKINLNEYNKIDDFLKKNLIKKYLFINYGNNIHRISSTHLMLIMDFIEEGNTNSTIDLPLDYTFLKGYDSLELLKNNTPKEYNYEFNGFVELPNGHCIEQVENSQDSSNYVTYLDSNEIKLPIFIRTYQSGDKMTIKNMNGHKKVSDIFTDEKVNIEERKVWPVVVDSDNNIIWLPGLKKTYFDRKNTGKYDIILKYY